MEAAESATAEPVAPTTEPTTAESHGSCRSRHATRPCRRIGNCRRQSHAMTGLHGAVARTLEKLRADRLGEYAASIAYHWEASGMRFEAARWQRRAALQVSKIRVKGPNRKPQPGT